MAIESKTHRPSPVVGSTASQSSKRDANRSVVPKFETYAEEWSHWVIEKRRLDTQLSAYTKRAFSAEQLRIRKQMQDSGTKPSFSAWQHRKAEMEQERHALVVEKSAVEEELARLKPLVAAERRRAQNSKPVGASLEEFSMFREDGSISYDGVAAQLVLEMRSVRKLLEEQVSLLDRLLSK